MKSVVVPIIARLHYLQVGFDEPKNIYFALVPATICAQIELHWGLTTATIPCLKPFMRAANTGYLGFGATFIERTHNSYGLSSMKHSHKSKSPGATAISTTNNDISPHLDPSNGISADKGEKREGISNGRTRTWSRMVTPKDGIRGMGDPIRHEIADNNSAVSKDGSEVGIIRHKRSWTIEYSEKDQCEGGSESSTQK